MCVVCEIKSFTIYQPALAIEGTAELMIIRLESFTWRMVSTLDQNPDIHEVSNIFADASINIVGA